MLIDTASIDSDPVFSTVTRIWPPPLQVLERVEVSLAEQPAELPVVEVLDDPVVEVEVDVDFDVVVVVVVVAVVAVEAVVEDPVVDAVPVVSQGVVAHSQVAASAHVGEPSVPQITFLYVTTGLFHPIASTHPLKLGSIMSKCA